MRRPRVLLAVTVYNGEAAVRRCLESVAGISSADCDVDVVVLDDASPAPGLRERLGALCNSLGFEFYTAPRNLGIPRNVNLGLLLGTRRSYDYVMISNSDVVYPTTAVSTMLAAATSQPLIGSVTAWSNNVSAYSLLNTDAERQLAPGVDWVSGVLGDEFGSEVIDIPAGISFSILIPVAVVDAVGLMDPVFGRGYCEEIDWSLRSNAAGYRSVLSLATFVYHEGGASTVAAGLLRPEHTTVPANEAILDMRYPQFRADVAAFVESGVMAAAHARATRTLVLHGARTAGYVVDVTRLERPSVDPRVVHCRVADAEELGHLSVVASFRGFTYSTTIPASDPANGLRQLFGCAPTRLQFYEHSSIADELSVSFGADTVIEGCMLYPESV